jgi:hypothetical protein
MNYNLVQRVHTFFLIFANFYSKLSNFMFSYLFDLKNSKLMELCVLKKAFVEEKRSNSFQ